MTAAGAHPAPARIVLEDLTKTFGGGRAQLVPAVDKVSFQVHQGEFVALIGPSGCGKSTILNMIAGLIPITGGTIRIDGHEVAFGKPTPKAGYVFQRDTVYPWRTVKRNIGLGLELRKLPKAEREIEVERMVDRAGLAGFENAFPITLSGGMRQRVSLMRTLIMRPEILLMDEPFGALDTHTKLEMHRFLLQLWDEEKQTVLFITHDLGEALTLSDRIVVLSARPGRIKDIFDVPFARPRDAVTLRETAEYSALFSRIWHSLGEEFRKTSAEG
jgi:NitT/TauT family transport system ATP-binding protein